MSGAAASSPPRLRKGGTAQRRPAAKAAPKGPGMVARAVAMIPIRPETIRRLGNWLLGLLVLAAVVAGLILMGLPQMVGVYIGETIGRMGFAVHNIEVVGLAHADRSRVYQIVQTQQVRPMPLVDLTGTREQLMRLAWVGDARVSRRLPDTLVVDIVERKPAAVWQYQGQLRLIDNEGRSIAAIDPAAMPEKLPLVIGPGANMHAAEFAKLIDSQPALKPLVAGAAWIGDRRWDLRFQSGETLALPEGEKQAIAAFDYFARRDAAVRLLGQNYVRFDMRDPSRVVVRVTSEPGRRIAEPVDRASI
ncbi:FtsQ-type POTRA domain-containing protein [Sphingomonas naphthae]|uniref:Cell division protein FtsQ n=1 Tax=Sphingomonas naphthae TaxID=1813468 RepID=A0ABY7TLH0_9SPHN|nr:cell division protein FtsQ/DivIB [Sphingomonas naphthae]WCT74014.1 FtsQ-type POTRA domain-containing protein [Sphingomonas naphthae]